MFDLTVFIGRFSPIHRGHMSIIKEALLQSDRLLMLVGSSYRPRTVRNPFTFDERESFIRSVLTPEESERVIIEPLEDYTYKDQAWIEAVQASVKEYSTSTSSNDKIALIGYEKDHTSYYLNMFPTWASISVKPYRDIATDQVINSTDIRELIFKKLNGEQIFVRDSIIPGSVLNLISKIKDMESVVEDYISNIYYNQQFIGWPYGAGPIHQTVDAVIIQSGHVLLVERKFAPGAGLYALPGGFLNYNETLVESMIRELKEETGLKVPKPMLIGNIKQSHVFDAPHRSSRGRIITQGFYIELPNGPLFKVKGGDDAAKAFWMPLADLDSENMYEDHFDIINYFVG